jgi:hypothetical protein
MRYEVTVTRTFIVYAEGPGEAESKVKTTVIAGVPCVAPETLQTTVRILPDVREEGHGPEIDIAPARETRVG